MPGRLDREEQRRSGLVATVAIGTYAGGDGTCNLPHVEAARQRFTELTQDRLGFGAAELRLDQDGGTREDVLRNFTHFLQDPAERKILYWTGHGVVRDGDYLLACSDSYGAGTGPDSFSTSHAVSVEQLALAMAAGNADALLIVDACYAQSPVKWIRAKLQDRGAVSRHRHKPGFAVVCTAGVGEQAREGLWVDWLQDVLDNPDTAIEDHVRPFQPTALYVPFPYLMRSVDTAAVGAGVLENVQSPVWDEIRQLRAGFLHNPHYKGEDVLPPAEWPQDHRPWFGKGRGSDDLRALSGDAAMSALQGFTGRHKPLSRIVKWLEAHANGLLAVTGPAGSGKTTLLNYLAHLTVPDFYHSLSDPPPLDARPGFRTIHAALHCRGRTLRELAGGLYRALAPFGLEQADPENLTSEECVSQVAALARRAGALNLVFDGLDEAAVGQAQDIARDLLNRLAACAGVKVLVGTRIQPRRILPGAVSEETLIEALEQTVPALALDHDEDAERDIERHVRKVLGEAQSPYARPGAEEALRHTAVLVAQGSNRLFLVADLFARSFARADTIVPQDLVEVSVRSGSQELNRLMAGELQSLDPDGRMRFADLLRPLALAQGAGLPFSVVWLAMANAVRPLGTQPLTREALDNLVRVTNGTLIARVSDGKSDVYRLQHPSFGSHLLEGQEWDHAEMHRRIYEALLRPSQHSWPTADDYAKRYLAAHAALASPADLELLLSLADFLVHADPDVLLPLVIAHGLAGERAVLYQRVAEEFRHRSAPEARWALLRAAALVNHPTLLLGWLSPPRDSLWEDTWTDALSEPLHLRWPGPSGGVLAVEWSGAGQGLITCSGRGEVVTRRPDTGRRIRVHRTTAESWRVPAPLRAVAVLGEGDRRTVVSHDESSIYMWSGNERMPTQCLFWGGSPETLAVAEFGDMACVAVADDGQSWLWQWPVDERPSADNIRRLLLPATARRVALLALEDALFVLSGEEGGVNLYEIGRRAGAGGPSVVDSVRLLDSLFTVYAVATLAQAGDRGWLGAADGESVHLWQLTDALLRGVARDPLFRIPSAARGLALGLDGDTPLIAVQDQRTVEVWRSDDRSRPQLSYRTQDQHNSLAFDPRGTGQLAVADGSHVRVLNRMPGKPPRRAAHPRGHDERAVLHLAAGSGGGDHLLCRASGEELWLSLHHAGGVSASRSEPVIVRHAARITAVSALRTGPCWTVVTVADRTAHIWCVPGHLDGPAVEEAAIGVDGDREGPVPAVTVADEGSRVLVNVPSGQWLACWAGDAGPHSSGRQWRPAGRLPFQEALRARWTGSVSAPGGRVWLAADCATSLTVWELSGQGSGSDGISAARSSVIRPHVPARAAALGCLEDGGEFVPLLAWVAGDGVRLALCDVSRPRGELLAGLPADSSALVMSGPLSRPLLFACGGDSEEVAIWDVVGKRRLPSIPGRGYGLEAIAAVCNLSGVTLMLQGRDRCDQLLLRADRLADLLDISPHHFSPPIVRPLPQSRSHSQGEQFRAT
jgi:energy-coupling factor transporter ATP-binding protein EcfA2